MGRELRAHWAGMLTRAGPIPGAGEWPVGEHEYTISDSENLLSCLHEQVH